MYGKNMCTFNSRHVHFPLRKPIFMNSVKLWPTDIHLSDFGKNFYSSKLDFENADREKTREVVSEVLREVVALSNQKVIRNMECFLAKRPKNDKNILWVGKKRKRVAERFSVTY